MTGRHRTQSRFLEKLSTVLVITAPIMFITGLVLIGVSR